MAENSFLALRRLTGSELGWFAEPRKKGKARGRQRGINFNAADMVRIFSPECIASANIPVVSHRFSDAQVQERPIRLQEKNWRLVGDMVSGDGLENLEEGDFFWAEIGVSGSPPFPLVWDVITAKGNRDLHARIARDFSEFLTGGMASWPSTDPLAEYLATLVGVQKQAARESEPATSPLAPPAANEDSFKSRMLGKPASKPLPTRSALPRPRRKRIEDKLLRPHILAQIVKTGLALSAKAQANFIDVLDTLSHEVRSLLLESDLIKKLEINHRATWRQFKGIPIGFVDGGMANVEALGAAPLAIRVGSYLVIPGEETAGRERFDFEIQLVDDLYESPVTGSGVYEDLFEDIAKLRDAARISCEVGGLLSLTLGEAAPEIALLHGPLVNPVSPYALGRPGEPGSFPNFTHETLKKLLPGETKPRTGREANFVAVYLEELNRLRAGRATICGVVERPSSHAPGPLISKLLETVRAQGKIDAATYHQFVEKMGAYRITDSVILECVLDKGDYTDPVEMDKQEPHHKIPDAWRLEILSYPKPLTAYLKANAETMPLRIESFPTGRWKHAHLMKLILHMSRLLPRYSFPVGLDIVDKHAKVPEWMSRQMNAMLSAQLMRKAMEAGSPAGIRLVRRILSANTRDWLFRPDFKKG